MNTDVLLRKELLDVLPFLYPEKAQRLCDVKLYFPKSADEEVEAALEWLVAAGRAEKYDSTGCQVYFKKM